MGVLELKIIECGNTSLDYELALSGHPDRIATSGRPSRTTGILRHPIYAYVIEHTDGRVLVDTAVSVNYQQEWRDRFYGEARLSLLGGTGINMRGRYALVLPVGPGAARLGYGDMSRRPAGAGRLRPGRA